MARVRESLKKATENLSSISDSPRLDAELLMAHALEISRATLLLHRLDSQTPSDFDALVDRRKAHEPLAYITGEREFWSLGFAVGPGVLIPRPDSETLIEAARAKFGAVTPSTILDLGTGSGVLLLAALSEWSEATGLGIDRSQTALSYARDNARRLGFAGRVKFRRGDWGTGIAARYDLILCNPPYVSRTAQLMPDVSEFEPSEALYADNQGMAEYCRIIPQLGGLLTESGIACLELGAGQAPAVSALCVDSGLDFDVERDLAGHERSLLIHS